VDIWQDVVGELEAGGHLCRNPQTPQQFIVCTLRTLLLIFMSSQVAFNKNK